MRYVVIAGMILGILSLPATGFSGENEPHWADVVKRYYPYWKAHYWVDRELWGNQGYIVGKPPRKLTPDTGAKPIEVEPVVIKKEPLEFTPEQPAEKPLTYTVKKGDCLWLIAGKPQIYGNPLKWPLIYKANKEKIKDPDLIYPGQVLTIPRD